MGSALKALRTATGVTGGSASGCVIRLVASGGAVANPTSVTNVAYAGQGELVVESDPAGAMATLSFGTASSALGWYQDYVRIRNVAMARTGGFFLGTSIRQLCLENVTLDNGSQGTPLIGATSGTATIVLAMGVALTNGGGAFNGASGTSEVRLLRGVSASTAVSYEMLWRRLPGRVHAICRRRVGQLRTASRRAEGEHRRQPQRP